MYANDLRNLIHKKNDEMKTTLDPRVDVFVQQFHDAIIAVYDNDKGGKYAGCSRIGIAIEYVDKDSLQEISFSVDDWILAGGEKFKEDYQMMTFWEYINQPQDSWPSKEISGLYWNDIYDLRYLVTEFEKRGFECYVDANNFKLIVPFGI